MATKPGCDLKEESSARKRLSRHRLLVNNKFVTDFKKKRMFLILF